MAVLSSMLYLIIIKLLISIYISYRLSTIYLVITYRNGRCSEHGLLFNMCRTLHFPDHCQSSFFELIIRTCYVNAEFSSNRIPSQHRIDCYASLWGIICICKGNVIWQVRLNIKKKILLIEHTNKKFKIFILCYTSLNYP